MAKQSTAKSTKSRQTKTTASKKSATKSKAITKPEAKVAVAPATKSAKPLKTKKESVITTRSLYKWNVGLAILHALQGILIVVLSKASTLPVFTHYLTIDELATRAAGRPVLVDASRHLFDVNLAYLVAAFFFMSAIAHTIVATVYRKRYEAGLATGINKVRWFEYSLSASTMMVAIALLSGVYDLSSLFMIFVLDAVMNLLGLAMEVYNQGKEKPNWLAYVLGCIAGIAPWIVFVIYVWGATVYGSGQIPTFVYWIYGSMFLFFNSFAINMLLQYKKKGKWANYLYGERVYMILSLVAKTLLAWQVFAGTLRP